MKELPVYLRKALLSRISRIVGRIPLPVLLLAPRRWLFPPSSDFFDILTVANSALSRSFLLTMCILAPESTTKLSFLGLYRGCGRQNPLLDGRTECSFVLFFELVNMFGKSPRVTAGASLLSFSLSRRSVLKFHSVGTSLMRNFDVFFTKRWTFIFSDTCLTWRGLCESYPSN